MNAAQLTALDLPAGKHRPPIAWLLADGSPHAFAACYRCTHGAEQGIERVCTHPLVLDLRSPLPVAVARSWGGGCGPDALRLCDPAIS
ncbi:MAG: hypothetical protein EOP35_19195 [Rubrivivax sp.]|nr:MAG: hypothetical protein EOP35_19195 [Rubrivivax sp.]